MSLQLALDNALSGLAVNRRALEVLSNNIANANTPGYTRKILELSPNVVDNRGAGVSIDGIGRKVDDYLQRAVQGQNAVVSRSNVISEYNDRVQILLGKPGANNSIDTYTNNFFNSLQQLAETPERPSLRVNAVSSGGTLANELSQLAGNLEDLRFSADRDIKASVEDVNRVLGALYNTNAAIGANSVQGKPVSDLLDTRDNLIKTLSNQLDVQYYFKSDGQVRIATGNGISLLDDNAYRLTYTATGSSASFSSDGQLYPINVVRLDNAGLEVGERRPIVAGGKSSDAVSLLTGGKIQGLLEIRDKQIPNILSQLDQMASRIRDSMNAIHNAGSAYPGYTQLTGSRVVSGESFSEWNGSVQLALVDGQGNPLPSGIAGDTNGLRPLTLDLSKMDSGTGVGKPNTQSIIDEINRYFGPPQPQARLGALNNIQLVSNSKQLPDSPAYFNFDFSLDNISGQNAEFFVTGLTVKDDNGANIAGVTDTIPRFNLSPTNTYSTVSGSSLVTVGVASTSGLANGDYVYLPNPGTDVNGIGSANLGGYFKIGNVSANGFTIEASQIASSSASVDVAGLSGQPGTADVPTGGETRSKENGTFTLDLTGAPSSVYYTVSASVAVMGENGVLTRSTVEYKIFNNQSGLLNDRFNASALTGDGTLAVTNSNQPRARAMLVDENGKELPIINGKYASTAQGRLKIEASGADTYLSIDSLDSQQLGFAAQGIPGTNRGFSHYFGLNNFYDDNKLTLAGDTVKNSALNLKVQDRLVQNANLISTGQLEHSNSVAGQAPNYTFIRSAGNNSIIQRLAKLGNDSIDFQAAGGLVASRQTFATYTGDILGSAAAVASNATTAKGNAQALFDGFASRADSISGVNLDQELADTVIYQNAYAASARIITTTKELYDTLLSATQ